MDLEIFVSKEYMGSPRESTGVRRDGYQKWASREFQI